MPYVEEVSKSSGGLATEVLYGVVEFATIPECQAGTTEDKVVRPHGLLFIKPTSPGTAYVGGILAGNTRGAAALDVQSAQANVAHVASGANSAAFGNDNTASGQYGVAIGALNVANNTHATTLGFTNTASGTETTAIGHQNSAGSGQYAVAVGALNIVAGASSIAAGQGNTASGANAVALGNGNTATQQHTVAIGSLADATATQANALGYDAAGRITRTTNLSGGIIIKKDSGEIGSDATLPILHGAGTTVVVMSQLVNLLTGGNARWTTPTGSTFWVDEVGAIVGSLTGSVTTTPTVSFGIDGNTTKYLAATQLTQLTTIRKRHHFEINTGYDGETILRADITLGGSGPSVYKGRFYWKGVFVED